MTLGLAALTLVAWLSPWPDRITDRDVYEATASQFIVPDCTDLHCFRVLVAWALGVLPGESGAKWKAYAVVANLAGGVAVFALCLVWGLSRRSAWLAASASIFGFGSLYTLHDPFTSDPLMYALGPAVMLLLLKARVFTAGAVASVGVLAKEFVAAPLFIYAVSSGLRGRWGLAAKALMAANAAFIVWLVLQLTLIIHFNYGYDGNASTNLLGGGYLLPWIAAQSPRAAALAMVNEFGALWLLAPAGLFLAPAPLRQLAVVSLPVAALFAYVQQPDRALWNFHFLVTPLAAVVLGRVSPPLALATMAAFAVANLRVGAQLPWVPPARFALAASLLLAVGALVQVWRQGHDGRASFAVQPPAWTAPVRAWSVALVLGAQAVTLAGLFLLVLDQVAHRRVESLGGVNHHGYRGPVVRRRAPGEVRIVLVGGSQAFGRELPPDRAIAGYLPRQVGLLLGRHREVPLVSVNLGAVELPISQLAARIEHFAYLEPDVLAVYPEPAEIDEGPVLPPFDSGVTLVTGYVPILPLVLEEKGLALGTDGAHTQGSLVTGLGRVLRRADQLIYQMFASDRLSIDDDRAVTHAIDVALRVAMIGVVVVFPMPHTPELQAWRDQLLPEVTTRAASDRRIRVVDLANVPELRGDEMRLDGVNYGAVGHSLKAIRIAPAIVDLLAGVGE